MAPWLFGCGNRLLFARSASYLKFSPNLGLLEWQPRIFRCLLAAAVRRSRRAPSSPWHGDLHVAIPGKSKPADRRTLDAFVVASRSFVPESVCRAQRAIAPP